MNVRLIYFFLLITSLILPPTVNAADEGAHAAEFLSHGVGARAPRNGKRVRRYRRRPLPPLTGTPLALPKSKKHSLRSHVFRYL